ncbi:hypothetical protein [uncultured Chryseobacterium sp.]|uniref:hypothetical protein n=1 Tax=uncultured Chryseobacterium sp. TaxID=259322 RepID=UPI0025F6A468|nr:hypothetical protein [uncultured Chryseobacterium sp.]
MSLTISFIYLSENVKDKFLNPESNLFGFEICRKELWGHKMLKDLGCKIISELNEKDLFIVNEELEIVYRDCIIILKNSSVISLTTNYSEIFIEYRVNNLFEFLKVALNNKDNLG